MRARMAIAYAGIEVGLREVALKDKPAAMLAASSKGTVPVLIETNGTVIVIIVKYPNIIDWRWPTR